MNDTSPVIENMIRKLYAELEPEQRFLIGIEMFETARAFALSSFQENITEQEKRRLLCERFYGRLSEKVFPNNNQ